MKKEFWLVEYSAKKLEHTVFSFYVSANSAAEAEKKGMPLAKRKANGYSDPGEVYCQSAELSGEIEV